MGEDDLLLLVLGRNLQACMQCLCYDDPAMYRAIELDKRSLSLSLPGFLKCAVFPGLTILVTSCSTACTIRRKLASYVPL